MASSGRNILRLARITRPLLGSNFPPLKILGKLLLRAAGPRVRPGSPALVAELDGMLWDLDLSSSLDYNQLFHGPHEGALARLMEKVLRPGDTCLDVGSNVGLHTLRMSRLVGDHGSVIAVEPHPHLCDRLRRNLALNDCRNVVILKAALSDTDGVVLLHTFAPGSYYRGISSLVPNERTAETMQVRAISGSTFRSRFRLTSLKLVKIDVEGLEPVVLLQLWPLIEQFVPYLMFEYRSARWDVVASEPVAELCTRLRRLGYHLYWSRKAMLNPLEQGSEPPRSCDIVAVPLQRPTQAVVQRGSTHGVRGVRAAAAMGIDTRREVL